MPYYVYILQSLKDNKYYIGSTSNVDKRLQFHNTGSQRSTRNRIPFKLIYKEELSDKITALKREKQIKSYKGGEAFKRLISGNRGV
ncbi:MAG: GIY-YIG nuclease family protein [Bacteroidales bacterium]|nr:GIY-YIG nuclease family protein [Bacteroidales bacterium]